MSNNIRQEIDKIDIPPELHERSQMGVRQAMAEREGTKHHVTRWWTHRKIAAAWVLAFIVMTTAIFNTEVIAAIQKALQYFPGTGLVIEEEVPQERYVLEKPVTSQIDGGPVVITGMLVDEKMTYVTMSGTNSPRVQQIKIINEQGTAYSLEASGGAWTTDKWARDFWHQGKLDIKGHIQVVIGENPGTIIPLTLTKAETFSSYQDMGETSTANGVTITLLAKRVDGKARISLLAQHPTDFRISNYAGMNGVYEDKQFNVKDETGKTYELEHDMGLSSPASEFYFKLSETVKNYTVTIPEINVTYDDTAKISLDIPSEVGIPVVVNKTFDLAGFPVKITKLERMDLNQLRMYVDLNYKEYSSRSLHQFKVNSMSQMAQLNQQTGAVEFIQFDIKPDSQIVNLTITGPEVVIRGPWKFELPTEKFFDQ